MTEYINKSSPDILGCVADTLTILEIKSVDDNNMKPWVLMTEL